VVAAIAGHAVADRLERALWCDLRVVEQDAVPVGQLRAPGPNLAGAARSGLRRRVRGGWLIGSSPPDRCESAGQLAREIAAFPQFCLGIDRKTVCRPDGLDMEKALAHEFAIRLSTIDSGETQAGATRFWTGATFENR
jgi:enoyl-CoA hydratase